MKLADRFRVDELLCALAAARLRVTLQAGQVLVTSTRGEELTRYARSLWRELAELYTEHPSEVGQMIAARKAA